MLSKGKWLTALKRALMPQCSQGDYKKNLDKSKQYDSLPSMETTAEDADRVLPPAPIEDFEPTVSEDEQNKHAYSVAVASVVAAEAAAVAAQAAAQVVRLTSSRTRFSGKSREDIAATKIQTAFRGYQARRALRALKGLVRLKRLVYGDAVKSQTTNTLHCMQTMARVQSQIHSRMNLMKKEDQAIQRHLQLKYENEIDKVKIGEEWNDSPQSKERTEAKLLNKKEAAKRRERTLAYAFSHQWKSSSRSLTPILRDPSNPQLGWSWLAHWMARKPWEKNHGMTGIKEHASTKSAISNVVGQTMKPRDTILDRIPSDRQTMKPHDAILECIPSVGQTMKPRNAILERSSSAGQKPSHPASYQSLTTLCPKPSSVPSRKKSMSPRGATCSVENDSKSMLSLKSERRRRHSISGLSARDNDTLVSSVAVPSYMAPTESARARSRLRSRSCHVETTEKGSSCPVKKHPSVPAADKNNASSLARSRRHSMSSLLR